jgi:sterol desaturase/sphingolipid hydroxylase (fatty acid hydroxylase superfamily)
MTFYLLELVFVGTYLISSAITYYLDTKTEIRRIEDKPKNLIITTYSKIYKNVIFNLLITNTILFYIMSKYINIFNKEFTLISFILDASLIYILIDAVFYSFHILLHTKYLYRFHKKHHELLDPVGLGAVYAHPIDYIFGLTLPIIIPCIITSAHINTVLFILFLSTSNSVIVSHSGYNIFTFNNLNPHHIHHTKFIYNYGINLYMDKFFGTYKE